MITWIIVGVVAAILVSNLAKLMPRGRERHLHRLREQARQSGFAVEWLREAQRVNQLAGCIAYRMPLERAPLAQEFSCRREADGWVWLHGSEVTPGCTEVLKQLPEQVRGIDRQSLSVVVYWREPDDPAVLTQLVAALEPLKAPSQLD
ncbi:hypothetical protein SAMN05216198_1256 [Halopseudomonas litoralis]|uniref:Uncharacterized protein n=1 Tax=Halopseudomonas litoralis TaxID=797277 RepID=A0A1H1PQS8_9GAMM|nr:hypothetical protein [Halopseudomonas litoralis]SDS13496.1 hypothetical protein SAMN05216198_1256 [Halopseudomonas litoralis]